VASTVHASRAWLLNSEETVDIDADVSVGKPMTGLLLQLAQAT
jgi:hypothetical protein